MILLSKKSCCLIVGSDDSQHNDTPLHRERNPNTLTLSGRCNSAVLVRVVGLKLETRFEAIVIPL